MGVVAANPIGARRLLATLVRQMARWSLGRPTATAALRAAPRRTRRRYPELRSRVIEDAAMAREMYRL